MHRISISSKCLPILVLASNGFIQRDLQRVDCQNLPKKKLLGLGYAGIDYIAAVDTYPNEGK